MGEPNQIRRTAAGLMQRSKPKGMDAILRAVFSLHALHSAMSLVGSNRTNSADVMMSVVWVNRKWTADCQTDAIDPQPMLPRFVVALAKLGFRPYQRVRQKIRYRSMSRRWT